MNNLTAALELQDKIANIIKLREELEEACRTTADQAMSAGFEWVEIYMRGAAKEFDPETALAHDDLAEAISETRRLVNKLS